MGKINSNRKGKEGERELARKLIELGFNGCRRGQQYNGIEGEDVVGIDGLHIESKRTETLQLEKALEQAKKDGYGKGIPIVCHRKNRGKWIIILELENIVEFSKIILKNAEEKESE